MEHIIAKGAVPDKVRDALAVLWEHADDAYWSVLSQQELDEEGFNCSAATGYLFKFVYPVLKPEDNRTFYEFIRDKDAS